MLRIFLFSLLSSAILGTIGLIFWQQELQYIGPTPVPSNYNPPEVGKYINSELISKYPGKPLFVHFYNDDCPCSRFNIKEFRNMVYQFREQVNFVAIIQSENALADENFEEKYDLGIPVLLDKTGKLAEELGVYSTPQAIIVKDSKLYFRGNYNRARFCTTKNTKFAELALKALIKGEDAPYFPELAFTAYGCELPANQDSDNGTFNFFDL